MYSHEYYAYRQLLMDTTHQNDPWSSLHALLICPMLIKQWCCVYSSELRQQCISQLLQRVNYSASRSCCSASTATKFFNSIDAVILHHVKDLIECSRCFIYGHSGINIIIIIILINMMMIQLLKCIIETLMCGGTMVAMTKCCDNVLVTYMEEYGDTEAYCDNVIEFHDTSSSLPLPSLSGSGIHSSQK
jgi:hypothetical protein